MPPTPGKPSQTSPGMFAGIADRPPGLLPKNSTAGRAGKRGELGACAGELVASDGGQDQVVAPGRVRDDADPGLGPASGQDVAGGQAAGGDVVGPGRVMEHVDDVAGGAEVGAVHGPDYAAEDEHFHDALLPFLLTPLTMINTVNYDGSPRQAWYRAKGPLATGEQSSL